MKMKTVETKHGKQTIIKQKGHYTLLAKYYKESGEFHEYVVAFDYQEDGSWGHGNYFWHDLAGAIDYFKMQTEQNYISRKRLEEISTIALHGLAEEDVYDFYEGDLDLEDHEVEFFGMNVCYGCKYYEQCGSRGRIEQCDGKEEISYE